MWLSVWWKTKSEGKMSRWTSKQGKSRLFLQGKSIVFPKKKNGVTPSVSPFLNGTVCKCVAGEMGERGPRTTSCSAPSSTCAHCLYLRLRRNLFLLQSRTAHLGSVPPFCSESSDSKKQQLCFGWLGDGMKHEENQRILVRTLTCVHEIVPGYIVWVCKKKQVMSVLSKTSDWMLGVASTTNRIWRGRTREMHILMLQTRWLIEAMESMRLGSVLSVWACRHTWRRSYPSNVSAHTYARWQCSAYAWILRPNQDRERERKIHAYTHYKLKQSSVFVCMPRKRFPEYSQVFNYRSNLGVESFFNNPPGDWNRGHPFSLEYTGSSTCVRRAARISLSPSLSV